MMTAAEVVEMYRILAEVADSQGDVWKSSELRERANKLEEDAQRWAAIQYTDHITEPGKSYG